MSELFNQIPVEEQHLLMNYITTYRGTCSEDNEVGLKYLLREWDYTKTTLYRLLGNQLKYSRQVSYNKPVEEVRESMREAIEGLTFVDNYLIEIRTLRNNNEIDYDTFVNLKSLTDIKTLTDNKYKGDTFKLKTTDGSHAIQIQHEAKPSRILAKIASAYNIEGFEEFRLAHSQVLNDKKIEGTLTFSIHPLDYFTMSDNDSGSKNKYTGVLSQGWKSCMNWRFGGCYRQGTVEMCNSPYVVVVYLENSKPMEICGKKWNNKRWRNLFIVDEDVITGIKGYPFQSNSLDRGAIKILMELAKDNLGWEYEDNIFTVRPDGNSFDVNFSDYEDYEDSDRYVRCTFETHAMYNDFGNSNRTHMVFKKDVEDIDICYSGASECMCCGTLFDGYDGDYFTDEESLLICEHCLGLHCCEYCGEETSGTMYEVDGMEICPYCYENRTIEDFLGDVHMENNIVSLYVALSPEEVNEDEYYKCDKKLYVYTDTDISEYVNLTNHEGSFYLESGGVYCIREDMIKPEHHDFIMNQLVDSY